MQSNENTQVAVVLLGPPSDFALLFGSKYWDLCIKAPTHDHLSSSTPPVK